MKRLLAPPNTRPCGVCLAVRPIKGRGLCSACYERERYHGRHRTHAKTTHPNADPDQFVRRTRLNYVLAVRECRPLITTMREVA